MGSVIEIGNGARPIERDGRIFRVVSPDGTELFSNEVEMSVVPVSPASVLAILQVKTEYSIVDSQVPILRKHEQVQLNTYMTERVLPPSWWEKRETFVKK